MMSVIDSPAVGLSREQRAALWAEVGRAAYPGEAAVVDAALHARVHDGDYEEAAWACVDTHATTYDEDHKRFLVDAYVEIAAPMAMSHAPTEEEAAGERVALAGVRARRWWTFWRHAKALLDRDRRVALQALFDLLAVLDHEEEDDLAPRPEPVVPPTTARRSGRSPF
jgi:hypothetical protein